MTVNAKRRRPDPLKADPSRTAGVRRRWLADLRRRFRALRRALVRLVAEEDAFGLKPPQPGVFNQRWRFATDPDKLRAFREWLRQQLRSVVTGSTEEELWRRYVEDGFRQGAGRAFDDTRRVAPLIRAAVPGEPAVGQGIQFIPHPNQRKDEVTVYLDPHKVDASWQRGSPEAYIPPGGGGAEIGGRRAGFEQFLAKGKPVQASRATLYDGNIDFIDGRHRFSLLRDKGVTKVAVTVPREQAEEIVRKFGATEPDPFDFRAGSKEEFLRSAFGRPESVNKVQLLAGRSFDDLEGVTAEMSGRMARVLADGLVRGQGPREVARALARQVGLGAARAETIARTELIAAHAEGQLLALEQLGVEEVGVLVEWVTAGDDRVCPRCKEMEGQTFKVKDAHGLIPKHPRCRCAFAPANVGESPRATGRVRR